MHFLFKTDHVTINGECGSFRAKIILVPTPRPTGTIGRYLIEVVSVIEALIRRPQKIQYSGIFEIGMEKRRVTRPPKNKRIASGDIVKTIHPLAQYFIGYIK